MFPFGFPTASPPAAAPPPVVALPPAPPPSPVFPACVLGANQQLAYTSAHIPTNGQVCTGVALWFDPSSTRPALVFSAGRHTGQGTNFVLLPDSSTATGFQIPISLPGVLTGSFSGIAIDKDAHLLLAGDDGATGIQPSLLYQLPRSGGFAAFAAAAPSALPLLWTQQRYTLLAARGCAFGATGQLLLGVADGRLAVYSGWGWTTETLLRPVPYLPATFTSGVDCTPTAVSVSCNPRTGSVAVGIRQNWHSLGQAAAATGSGPAPVTLATTPCIGGFRPSALLRGPDFAAATPVLLPTNMQAVGAYVGPILAPCSDDVVVVGSGDNGSDDFASVPLLFPNGDGSRAIALTAEPVQGRAVAVADISGNGLPDVFIAGTGAFHYLLLQRAVGVFIQQKIPTGAPAGTYRGVAVGRVYGNPRTMEVVLSSTAFFPGSILSFTQPCTPASPAGTSLAALPTALAPAGAVSPARAPGPAAGPSRSCSCHTAGIQAPLFYGVVGVLLALLIVAAVLAGVFGHRARSSTASAASRRT